MSVQDYQETESTAHERGAPDAQSQAWSNVAMEDDASDTISSPSSVHFDPTSDVSVNYNRPLSEVSSEEETEDRVEEIYGADLISFYATDYPAPVAELTWPEGERDIPPIARDANGRLYIPEHDQYRGINWLLEAAEDLGDIVMGRITVSVPATEVVGTQSNGGDPNYQPSVSDSSLPPSSTEAAPARNHGRRPQRGISAPSNTLRRRPGTQAAQRSWSQDEIQKLIQLRDPSRKGGRMPWNDIAKVVGRSGARACRLQRFKLYSSGQWPYNDGVNDK